MHRVQCVLSGILGMVIAFALAFFAALCALVGFSLWLSRRSGGEIGWDPVSLGRQHPLIFAVLVTAFIGFLAFGFLRGYQFRAHRLARS